ncbi:MAG TPA: hypothetical protein DDW52_17565 [Planctomycetaceae bacterium]|nr:hypothetical protein [Planctomycetaceae bacterium]
MQHDLTQRHVTLLGLGPQIHPTREILGGAGIECAVGEMRNFRLPEDADIDIALTSIDFCASGAWDPLSSILKHSRNVVVLTPLAMRAQIIQALALGVDDFVSIPLNAGELLGRLECLPFRRSLDSVTTLDAGPLSIDLSKHRVSRDGQSITLTPTEYRLLELLARNQGSTVTRQTLVEHLWNTGQTAGGTNVIEVHINRLRQKVEEPDSPRLIRTVRGSGYCLQVP